MEFLNLPHDHFGHVRILPGTPWAVSGYFHFNPMTGIDPVALNGYFYERNRTGVVYCPNTTSFCPCCDEGYRPVYQCFFNVVDRRDATPRPLVLVGSFFLSRLAAEAGPGVTHPTTGRDLIVAPNFASYFDDETSPLGDLPAGFSPVDLTDLIRPAVRPQKTSYDSNSAVYRCGL